MTVFVGGASGRLGSLVVNALAARGLVWAPLTTPQNSWDWDLLKASLSHGSSARSPQDSLCIVDVTLAEGTESLCCHLLSLSEEERRAIRFVVIGSTGHSEAQRALMRSVGQSLPVILVSNFSRGVFLMQEILEAKTRSGLSVSELARSLGFDLGMVELHHTKKMDAPSGTALTLATSAGISKERIASLRVGHVIGEHTIVAAAESEEVRLSHIAQSRTIFAEGAGELVSRLAKRNLNPGLYSFADIMNLMLSTSSPSSSDS